MSYAMLLVLPLLLASVLAVVALRRDRRGWAAVAIAAAAVLALTVVFDSIMIGIDLFRYDDALLLGAHIGLAPIEDLAYALIAVGIAVAVWRLWPVRGARSAAAEEHADA